jgi:exosortase/archaeosortase family protein
MTTFWFNNLRLTQAMSAAVPTVQQPQQAPPMHQPHLSGQNLSRLLQVPGFVPFAVRIDRAPEWLWLTLLAAALWPTFWWMGQRMVDGSDDPLGLLALATLGVVVWVHRRALRAAPRLGWLALALVGTLATTATRTYLPDLASALIALLALAAGLVAFLPARVAVAPVLGLSVLSLPLLASMQFYAGYPLRVVTAEASRWLLALMQHEVSRSGSSLMVNGHLVIVDAPCSGVQMVWLGYFTACVVALYTQNHSRQVTQHVHRTFNSRTFLTRLPAVSALVLLGNVVRNTLLVAAEASGWHLPGWAHDAVGLVVLAAVCGGIAGVMARPAPVLARNAQS